MTVEQSPFELLCCAPSAVERLMQGYKHWMTAPQEFENFKPQAFDRLRGKPTLDRYGAYRIEKGAALIPVMGMLIPSGMFFGSVWGMTSQEGLRAEIQRAMDDEDVDKIVLMVDSPGGFASGTDTTAAMLRKARDKKPVVASVSGQAASAAYWIAAQADEIVSGPIAEIGSIGVMAAHMDLSAVFQQMGVKVTLIYAGSKKVDGNPYEALTERVKWDMQQRVESLRMAFANEVVLGRRGAVSLESVLRTEGATFLPSEAVSMGLSDKVEHLDEVLARPGRVVSDPEDDDGDDEDEDYDAAAETVEDAVFDNDEVFSSSKPDPVALAEAAKAGRSEGRDAERKRIESILGHALAEGREALAQHFAFETSLPLDIVVVALEVAPLGGKVSTAPTLAEEMRSYKKPVLGVDAGPSPKTMSLSQLGEMTARKLLGKK